MGLVERVQNSRSEQRTIAGVPWRLRPWDNPLARFDTGGPTHPSRSVYGADEALRLVPVYAAVRLLSEYISSLPLKVYLKDSGSSGRARRYTGPSIFDDPAPSVNLMDWLYEAMTSLLLHGNAWGYILGRDGFGYPTQISWMPPEMVTVIDDESQPFNPLRSRVYFYGRLMNREEYFHIKAFSIAGRTEAISPLRAFALTILNGMEATRYGTDWFRAGGFPPGTFQNCVDTETEILTRDGWRHYDQLLIGTEVLTLNTQTGQSEWQPVRNVYVNEGPNDVIEMRNKSHSSVSTLNHRWPVMISGRYKNLKNGTRWEDPARWRIYTSETLPRDARICAAAPVVPPAEPKWSDAFTELIAWFFTEGCVHPQGQVGIYQSHTRNPDKVARIRAALTEVFGPPSAENMYYDRSQPQWQERIYARSHDASSGVGHMAECDGGCLTSFCLNLAASRVLTKIAPEKIVSTRFLSELTRAQLELFIQTAIDGDGSRGNPRGGCDMQLSQTDVRRLEPFQIACALAGRSGAIRGPAKNGQFSMGVQKTVWRKPNGHAEYVTRKTIDGPVWCPSTSNKTWFARRDGTCYFTSNTEIEIDPSQSAEIRSMLTASIRRREPLVYGRDWTYHPVTIPPSESQFVEAMRLNASQIAAVYGLPPERVGGSRGDSLTYSNVQESALQIIEAMRPWLVRLESAFFRILPANRLARFNSDALLKTDLQTRANIFRTWRDIGYKSVDEMREIEDLEPLPGGVGNDNIPLDAIVGMSRSTRAIPNSLLPQVTLESRLALEYLQALQQGMEPPGKAPGADAPSGPGAGNAPPPIDVPGAGSAYPAAAPPGQSPAAPQGGNGALPGIGGYVPPNPEAFLAKIVAAVRQSMRDEEAGPEFVGPWIPPKQTANGRNGHH